MGDRDGDHCLMDEKDEREKSRRPREVELMKKKKTGLVMLVYEIRQSLLHRRSISVKYTPRGSNALVDCLAKEGTNAVGERLEWGS
ncbi:hypothetical protein QYF36_015864 [Acer negundo]|nr:hypothetical protein QYF36_015864 [Acer negundo]